MLEHYLKKEVKHFPEYIEKLFGSEKEVRGLEGFVRTEFEQECDIILPSFRIKPYYELELLILRPSSRIEVTQDRNGGPFTEKELRRMYHYAELEKTQDAFVNITAHSYQKGSRLFLNYYSLTFHWMLTGEPYQLKRPFLQILFHEAAHLFFHVQKISGLYEKQPWVEETICDVVAEHFASKFHCPPVCSSQDKHYLKFEEEHLPRAAALFKKKKIEEAKKELDKLSAKVSSIYKFPYLSFFGADYYNTLPDAIYESFREGEGVDRLTDALVAAEKELGLPEILKRISQAQSVKEIYRRLGY